MRESLKAKAGWLWPLAFLALPHCSFNVAGLSLPPDTLNRGTPPHNSAIFCDIESRAASARHCATPEDLATGIPLARAAIALTRTQASNVGLDYSPVAAAALGCSTGQPVAITFSCPFPDGCHACLNCGDVIPAVYADVNAACVAFCEHAPSGETPPPDEVAFCEARARAATNAGNCFDGLCTNGALVDGFVDPRRTPEPVQWADLVGVAVSGADANTLTRTAADTGVFDAGAHSTQTVAHGDGYVEFTVAETDKGRVLGFSTGGGPDTDPTTSDIGFGIRVSNAATIFFVEGGADILNPDAADNSFGTYATGDRLRVSVTDNLDGSTGTITYSLIPAACVGPSCDGMMLRTAPGALYPLRVDASFNHHDGTLGNVRLVRIK